VFNRLFRGIGRALGLQAKTPAVAVINTPPPADIAQAREELSRQQAALDAQRAEFARSQEAYMASMAQLTADMQARPSAVPQGIVEGPPKVSSAGADAEQDANLDSQRRGRSRLRIDLQTAAPTTGGLNIPRG
jgi:hypothetical protein